MQLLMNWFIMNNRPILLMISFFFVGLISATSWMMFASSPSSEWVAEQSLVKESIQSVEQSRQACQVAFESHATDKGRTKVNNDELTVFKKFAPSNSTGLFFCRPSRLVESAIEWGICESQMESTKRFFDLPQQLCDVELLIVAAEAKTFSDLTSSRYRREFNDIGAMLSQDDAKIEQLAKEMPTRFNYMNNDFASLIQFKKTTSWRSFKTWFQSDKDFRGEFIESQWNDYRILEPTSKDTCAVLQLDERTFVIGNKKRLTDAITRNFSESPKVSQWISGIKESNFEGEFFMASDVLQAPDRMGVPFVEKTFLNKVSGFEYAWSLKQGDLAQVSFVLPSESAANDVRTSVQESIEKVLEMKDRNSLGLGDADDDFPAWESRLICSILRSIKFQSKENTASFVLPRPVGLEQLVKEYNARFNAYSADFEQSMRSQQRTVKMAKVMVAAKNIPAGSTITVADIRWDEWPVEIIPDDCIQEEESVLNRKANHHITRGLPILYSFVNCTRGKTSVE